MSHAIATGHRLTAEAAAEMLAAGGSAVDAAIAAGFAAMVAEPVLAGAMGGGFLMVVPAEGEPSLLDAFVTAPRRAKPGADIREVTVDFGTATQDFHIGAGTIALPCLVPGLAEAHARHGRLPFAELLAPAIRLARDGVEVTEFQSHLLDVVAPIYGASAPVRAIHFDDDRPVRPGAVVRMPELAGTFEALATEGPVLFTGGAVATALAALPGSQITAAEIAAARPRWRRPLTIHRARHQVLVNPPPSLGGVQIALALRALPKAPAPALLAEALAEIAALRAESGLDVRPASARRLILSPPLVMRLKAVLAQHMGATRGTTHISVLDGDGMGAALTLSNGEGCGLLLPGTGVMPNNMLGEEDLVPGGAARFIPRRRLASMMCPMAIRAPDGGLTLMGSGGSNRIRTALTQVALNLIDRRMTLAEAIAAPRLHMEGRHLDAEAGLAADPGLSRDWADARHWPGASFFFGGVHAVRRRGGGVEAAGDLRRGGVALSG